jgi:hypothetical protein
MTLAAAPRERVRVQMVVSGRPLEPACANTRYSRSISNGNMQSDIGQASATLSFVTPRHALLTSNTT